MVRIWVNIALNGPKLCTHSKFSPIRGNDSMFDLAYYNPKLSGNVYRGTRKCGKNNCRCATSPKNKHPFWRLEYRIRDNGRWRRKREYVPKNKVKSLRQRIKRAKQKDKQRRQNIEAFVHNVHLLRRDYYRHVSQLNLMLQMIQQPMEPKTLRQKTLLLKVYIDLIIMLS